MHATTIIPQNSPDVKNYLIGKTIFSVEKPLSLPTPQNLSLFAYDGDVKPSVHYTVKELPFDRNLVDQTCKAFAASAEIHREDRIILLNGSRECRLIFFHGAQEPYGIYLEHSDTEIEILVDAFVHDMLIYDTVFLSLFGLEKQMLAEQALILHCAYMLKDGKAVLFSAPSGTGKSTQADLWEKYRGTRTINGDKALLYRHEDGWYAHGWPICGSSEICNNETYPIEAIVMLHQAKENAIEPLHGLSLVRKLMAQITINMWNPQFQLQVMDLIDELAGEIPVYELGCDISEGAVSCLEAALNS